MLNTLSTTFTETISLLIKSFRLSSLLPSLCFVSANLLLLSQPYEHSAPAWLKDSNVGLLISLLTVLIGYTLSYLNFPLIYLIEGYPLRDTPWGKLMIAWYQDQKDALVAKSRGSNGQFYKDELLDCFPARDRCAPTALGNVTAAFESYPSQKYGIDAVYLWPRLLPILNEQKYAVFVEREKEGFDFFLNFSVLSGALVIECVLLRLVWGWPALTAVALISGCAAFAFYQAAVWCARSWGETIKTAFDLYRYQLAEQLALEPFADKIDETRRWRAISGFIKQGDSESFGAFRYPLPGAKRDARE
ncbi:MAG: hypothetical protein JW850_12420 [Thermoflexales bacterium]|nr:hypothetical protein [Thermoflexales bacterium]